MPALVLFGKRTALAGDDLTPSAILAMILRLVQFCFLCPFITLVFQLNIGLAQKRCLTAFKNKPVLRHLIRLVHAYWVLSLVLVLLSFPVEVAIYRTTRRGTPTEPEKRSLLKPLCVLKIIPLSVLRVFALVLGLFIAQFTKEYCDCEHYNSQSDTFHQNRSLTSWLYRKRSNDFHVEDLGICPRYSQFQLILSALVVMNFIEVAVTAFLYFYFIFKFINLHRTLTRIFGVGQSAERRSGGALCGWKVTCQLFCTCTSLLTCCIFGGLEATFSDFVDVATALEGFFDSGGHLDVTATDILAGLILLAKQQSHSRKDSKIRLKHAVKSRELYLKDRESLHKKPSFVQQDSATKHISNADKLSISAHQRFQSLSEHVQTSAHHSRSLHEFSNDSENADDNVFSDGDDSCSFHSALQNSDVSDKLNPGSQGSQTIPDGSEPICKKSSGRETRTSFSARKRLDEDFDQTFFEAPERELLNKDVEDDKLAILEGAHFINLAQAVYGFIMFMISHPTTGCCNLVGRYFRGACRGKVLGDCTGCHRISFLAEAGLESDALVYGTFCSGVRKRPYCIVIDKEWEAVVVVIRGTLSLEDALVDIQYKPHSLNDSGGIYGFVGTGEYCHAGMFNSAQWVYTDLDSHNLLSELLSGENCQYPGYKLYVIGHSLGAGVAAVLSIMLNKKFPDLKCLCFEPPGCVLSTNLAKREYITTYVVGADIVPRLSMNSLENLRDDVLNMIARIKIPKHKIFSRNPFRSIRLSQQDMIHDDIDTPDTLFARQVASFKMHQQTRRMEASAENVMLFPPGKRIVHLIKTSERRKSCFPISNLEFEYTPVWGMVEDFSVIALSSNFLSDHDPLTCALALKNVASVFSD